MYPSLVLFTLAKHLNNAAIEIELLEKKVLEQQISDATIVEETVEIPSAIAAQIDAAQIDAAEIKTSKKEKKNGNKKETCKEASSENASKGQVQVDPELPPVIPAEALKRELTLDIVRAECKKVIDTKGRIALSEILTNHGAAKTSDLKPEQYESVFVACGKALGVGHEF